MSNEIPDLFACAFPDGVKPEEYLPLLHVLIRETLPREVTLAVATLTGKPYDEVYKDLEDIHSPQYVAKPDIEQKLKDLLLACGWLAWIEANAPPPFCELPGWGPKGTIYE